MVLEFHDSSQISPNQSLDLGPSSQTTAPYPLGGLIIFEGFMNVNLLSLIKD